jgi:hypothetical protein
MDSCVPTASITLWAPSPFVSSLIFRHALVAPLFDEVGRAELTRESLPVRVAGHRDDPFGAELLGGEDSHQPDSAVADHGHGLAGSGFGGHGSEPASAEHVGGGQQRLDQVRVRLPRSDHEGAVRVRDASLLGLVPIVCGTNSRCTQLEG